MFELIVGFGDRAWVHRQLASEFADAGQLHAGPQHAAGHEVLDLVDDLPVDRHSVMWVDVEWQHLYDCMVTPIHQPVSAVKTAILRLRRQRAA